MSSQGLQGKNEHIQLLTVWCPSCENLWLAPGLGHGDTYACKVCGLKLVVSKTANRLLLPDSNIDAQEKTDT